MAVSSPKHPADAKQQQLADRVAELERALRDRDEKLERLQSETSSRFYGVLESLKDAFFTLDRQWRFTYLNAASERMLRRPRAELLGRRIGDEYPAPSGDAFGESYRRAMREGRIVEFEAPYEPLGLWLEVRAHPTEEGLAVSVRDVSVRHQEKEALRQIVERFRGVARVTSDAIWDWDIASNVTWWSEGMEALFGHSLTELETNASAWSVYIHDDDRNRVLATIYETLQSDAEAWSQEYRFARKDGSWAWVLDRAFVIRDADGIAVRMVGGMADQTERREAELELARLNRSLRMRSACSESMIRATDESELLTEVCRIAVEIGGYHMAWVGYAEHDERCSIRPVAHAGFEDGYLAEVALSWSEDGPNGRGPAGRAVRSGKPAIIEDLTRSAPETPWHHNARARGYRGIMCLPLRDREETFGLFGLYTSEVRPTTQDEVALLQNLADDLAFGVTSLRSRREREASQAALRASEKHVRSTFSAAAAGIAISSLSGGGFFALVNQAFCDMLGYTEEELRQVDVNSLTHPDDRAETIEHACRLIAGDVDSLVTEKRYIRKDGEIVWARVSVSLVPAGEGEGRDMIAVTQDITALKAAEQARESLENQLREAQKMEAIGTLAGGIAHDFNNILGAILGNTELARLDLEDNESALHSLAEIRRAGLRAKELIRQILTFSRRERPARRPVELAPIAEESVRLLRATMPSRAPIHLRPSAGRLTINADPVQIQQVLLNLGTNAVHAMAGHDGIVEISIDAVELDVVSSRLHPDLRPGSWVRLSVTDSGHGMDDATRQRIFEPFFTTKPVGKGTGLGLPVVHGIVRDHEGVIVVHSAPGSGTRFDLYFPSVAASQASAAASATAAGPIEDTTKEGAGRRILYIDDDPALLTLVRRLLSRRGYEVVAHTDAHAAVEVLRGSPDSFDLVLTDYNMPRMSGQEVAYAVREIRSDLPVAITSGYITEAMRTEAAASGVTSLIFKPEVVEMLCDEVARIVDSVRS